MVSDEQFTSDRRIRRRKKGRRRWSGSEFAATPSRDWKLSGGDLLRGPGGGAAAAAAVSSRKLAAALWRLAATADANGSMAWHCRAFHRFRFQLCSSMPIRKCAMEGVTKWDYCHSKASDDFSYFLSHWKNRKSREIASTSVASARHNELFKARKRINELESDRGWPRTKLEYCMKKFSAEAEKKEMCSIIKNLKDAVKRERKNCQNIELANAKLLHDIAEAKLSARKFMKNIEKQKKARDLWEEVCDKLAKEIKGNKDEIETLRNQQKRIQEEVEEARKMLQIAQVWREERAQMKLADAKLILENKYAEMNNLIADLEAFLRNSNSTADVNLLRKAEVLRQVFEPLKTRGNKEFPCILPKSVNKSMVFKDSHTSKAEGRIRHIDPKANVTATKSICSNGLTGGQSGKDTVTQAEICSSPTPAENEYSVNKIRRSKNENYESQKSESNEISSVKLGSSVSQRTMPRNKDTCKKVQIDGSRTLSNRSISSAVSMASSQRVLGEGALEGHDTVCQWSSSQHRNPHVVRAMKGHIEWPRGVRRNGLAANLLEAKLESQKMLLRNVLKQRS